MKDPIRYGSEPSQAQQNDCTTQGGLIVEGPLTPEECARGAAWTRPTLAACFRVPTRRLQRVPYRAHGSRPMDMSRSVSFTRVSHTHT